MSAEDAPLHAGFDPQLRVDWLGPAEFGDGRPGRLGLTILPGKHGTSVRYPGRVYRRDLGDDLGALRDLGVGILVLLVTDHELVRWGDPTIVAHGREAGVEIVRHPIPDGSPPASVAAMDAIIERIGLGRGTGDVAVACMGGVGRTGTVAACALVAAGHTARAAIDRVRAVRHPTAVETAGQVAFVGHYERHIAEGDRP